MKIVIAFTIIALSFAKPLSVNAQVIGGEYDKLAKLYEEGKFESCLLKADNYTYKEENARDAEPYLYMAMCFLELSKSGDPDIQADYANGVKEAVKNAQKFVKKDKEDLLYTKNLDFIKQLKQIVYDDTKKLFDSKNYSKAAVSAKSYNGLNRTEDPFVLHFIGTCYFLSNNLSGGLKANEDAKIAFKAQQKSKSIKYDKIFNPLAVDSFLKLSEYYIGQDNIKSAQAELQLGKELFPDNGYITMQLKMVETSLTKH